MSALQTHFPNGAYWNHPIGSQTPQYLIDSGSPGLHYPGAGDPANTIESVTWTPCQYRTDGHHRHGYVESSTNGMICCHFDNGLQCAGFARLLFYKYNGYLPQPPLSGNTGIKTGDLIKLSLEGSTHYAFVTGTSSSGVQVAEANVNDTCQIRWGHSYPYSCIQAVSHADGQPGASDPVFRPLPDRYLVRYRSGDAQAEGTMSDESFVSGKSTPLSLCAFSRPGYSFAGWTVMKNGSLHVCCRKNAQGQVIQTRDYASLAQAKRDGYEPYVLQNGARFARSARSVDETYTMTATWSPNSYQMIALDENGQETAAASLQSGRIFSMPASFGNTGWQLMRDDGSLIGMRQEGSALVFQDFLSAAQARQAGFRPVIYGPDTRLLELPADSGEKILLKPVWDELAYQTLYRLYNHNSGEHFYTGSSTEKDHLVQYGWKDEGTAWKAALSGNPVYRLYNPNAGDHHYTMNEHEKNALVSLGWKDEGIGWYSPTERCNPVWRQYNPNAQCGSHNFTVNPQEHTALQKAGWYSEGIAWFSL